LSALDASRYQLAEVWQPPLVDHSITFVVREFTEDGDLLREQQITRAGAFEWDPERSAEDVAGNVRARVRREQSAETYRLTRCEAYGGGQSYTVELDIVIPEIERQETLISFPDGRTARRTTRRWSFDNVREFWDAPPAA
jgi:hypothetical protein